MGKAENRNLGKGMLRKIMKVRKKCTVKQLQEKRRGGRREMRKELLTHLEIQLILNKSVSY